jgi:hypothetical protein
MYTKVSCNLFGGKHIQNDLTNVAKLLTSFFHHDGFLDIVPSDVIAGIVLLRIQQQEKVKLQQQLTYQTVGMHPKPTAAAAGEETMSPELGQTGFASQFPRYLKSSQYEDKVLMEQLVRHSVTALSLYTYFMAIIDRPVTAICRMCATRVLHIGSRGNCCKGCCSAEGCCCGAPCFTCCHGSGSALQAYPRRNSNDEEVNPKGEAASGLPTMMSYQQQDIESGSAAGEHSSMSEHSIEIHIGEDTLDSNSNSNNQARSRKTAKKATVSSSPASSSPPQYGTAAPTSSSNSSNLSPISTFPSYREPILPSIGQHSKSKYTPVIHMDDCFSLHETGLTFVTKSRTLYSKYQTTLIYASFRNDMHSKPYAIFYGKSWFGWLLSFCCFIIIIFL